MDGDWERVEKFLPEQELRRNVAIQTLQFLVREQKFLELLEQQEVERALRVLQNEITPLGMNTGRLHKLSSLLMCSDPKHLKSLAAWDGADGTSRSSLLGKLRTCISPSSMIPQHRLEQLLDQATVTQKLTCLYHNIDHDPSSLFEDHSCDRSLFPCQTHEILRGHTDEVWYLAFSHSGKLLATTSKDRSAIIWDLETMQAQHVLNIHTEPVVFVAWSYDDTRLITCGNDHLVGLWNATAGLLIDTMKRHTEPVTSCAWLPSGTDFVTGGMDKNVLLWNSDGELLHKWVGGRVTDLVVNKEGTRMVSICSERKIRVYDLITRAELFFLQEQDNITSICLSEDSRFALVNLSSQAIHMWDLAERRLVRRYVGQKQGKFVIRSVFGGIRQAFIASGSEDHLIYCWHRELGTLIEVLSGHTGTVNSISWNPTDPYMFASASDDHTVRIWLAPWRIKKLNQVS